MTSPNPNYNLFGAIATNAVDYMARNERRMKGIELLCRYPNGVGRLTDANPVSFNLRMTRVQAGRWDWLRRWL